jgi:hypothetical protein
VKIDLSLIPRSIGDLTEISLDYLVDVPSILIGILFNFLDEGERKTSSQRNRDNAKVWH